ncbi:MAG: dTDP-4-dehydrorhamnose 3,5-epimerase, partial [Thermodesulfobacteriota bacterium]|nr:dTDP-4-dehydrorhamnose 3,5-epimerase [Thermodesulfobacteriota bacterium]
NRDDSSTYGEINEFFIGEHAPLLITIPPFVYHGFKCISKKEALVINCPTEPYNYERPDEFRVAPHNNEIPYNWSRKDG